MKNQGFNSSLGSKKNLKKLTSMNRSQKGNPQQDDVASSQGGKKKYIILARIDNNAVNKEKIIQMAQRRISKASENLINNEDLDKLRQQVELE